MFPNVREANIQPCGLPETCDAAVAVGQDREEQFRLALDSYMRSYRASQHHAAAGRKTDRVAAGMLQNVVRLLLGRRAEVRGQKAVLASG